MDFKDKIKNCNLHEFKNYYNLYFEKYSCNKDVFTSFILKAYSLKQYEFVCEKLEKWFKNKKEILKVENELFAILIHSNIFLDKHLENYVLYLNITKKICWDNKYRQLILHRIEYSLYELGKYHEALKILEEIKHYSDKNYKNYIECLIKINDYEKALNTLKRYSPRTDEKKIWKSITLCEVYYYSGQNNQLKKFLNKAENTFTKHRVTDEEIPNAQYYYLLGTFHERLGNKIKAINYLKFSKETDSLLIIDIKYKKMAIKKLKEMGVLQNEKN